MPRLYASVQIGLDLTPSQPLVVYEEGIRRRAEQPSGRMPTISDIAAMSKVRRLLATFLHPMTWVHPFRLLHFYGYSHVLPRRKLTLGPGATIAPNVSLRNGERIAIGAGSKIGERASLWAGDQSGRITIGRNCRFGPEVFVTASDYGLLPDREIAHQERNEQDVVVGDDVWLGARAFVAAGVTIGDGCVVSAGSVVTKSLPAGSVAVGVPARIVRRREDYAPAESAEAATPA